MSQSEGEVYQLLDLLLGAEPSHALVRLGNHADDPHPGIGFIRVRTQADPPSQRACSTHVALDESSTHDRHRLTAHLRLGREKVPALRGRNPEGLEEAVADDGTSRARHIVREGVGGPLDLNPPAGLTCARKMRSESRSGRGCIRADGRQHVVIKTIPGISLGVIRGEKG